MQEDNSVQTGDRIALVDLSVVQLGTIASIVRRDPTEVRITWDDSFDDSGPEGIWSWPQPDLKPVA